MASSVFFKFKSQKEPTRVEFDGTGISVFELKRDIIIKSGLGDGTDFDLAIYSEDGSEGTYFGASFDPEARGANVLVEYDDDTTIIPRSTTVVARRLPPMKPGAGRAARYVSGKMPATAKHASKREAQNKGAAKPTNVGLTQMSNAVTEEEKMMAMFQAQSEQWTAQQEEMSQYVQSLTLGPQLDANPVRSQAPVFKPGSRKPVNVPDHDPPHGYICYRCGEKGHWIQLCPTNDNPEFDNRPRVKRTTGIPRSFLKTVDKPALLAAQGDSDDENAKAPSGIMLNAEGEFVVFEPDKASWEKFQAQTKSSAAAQEAASLESKDLEDRGLACPLDKRMFVEPMKTPCCEKTYCNDCIVNALIESDFVCPGCQSEGILIDDLKPDEEMAAKTKEYSEEKNKSKKAQENAKAKSPEPAASEAREEKASEANGSTTVMSPTASGDSPIQDSKDEEAPKDPKTTLTVPPSTNGNGAASPKKRPAEDELEDPTSPKSRRATPDAAEGDTERSNTEEKADGKAVNPPTGPAAMNNQQQNGPAMPFMPTFPAAGMPQMPTGPNWMGQPFPNMNMMPNFPMGMPNMNMNLPLNMMPNMGMPMPMPPLGMIPPNMVGMNMNMNMPGFPNMPNMAMPPNGGQGQMFPGPGGMPIHGGRGGGGSGGASGGHGGGNVGGPSGAPTGPKAMQGNAGHNGNYINNNQFNNGGGHNPRRQNFTAPNKDNDAYFRNPVNPHRSQNRAKRVRPSDYREL